MRFTLRGGPAAAGGESAVLRVFANRRLLAARPVTSGELGDGRRAVEIVVPVTHDGPPTPMAVQVEATGREAFGSTTSASSRISPRPFASGGGTWMPSPAEGCSAAPGHRAKIAGVLDLADKRVLVTGAAAFPGPG